MGRSCGRRQRRSVRAQPVTHIAVRGGVVSGGREPEVGARRVRGETDSGAIGRWGKGAGGGGQAGQGRDGKRSYRPLVLSARGRRILLSRERASGLRHTSPARFVANGEVPQCTRTTGVSCRLRPSPPRFARQSLVCPCPGLYLHPHVHSTCVERVPANQQAQRYAGAQ